MRQALNMIKPQLFKGWIVLCMPGIMERDELGGIAPPPPFHSTFSYQARRRGGSRGSNEPPLEVNNGGLKTQTVDFQLLANSGGM